MSNNRWIHEVHHLDARRLLALVAGPHQHQAVDLLYEIRSEIIRASDRRRPVPENWQEAWNAATGATPQRPGRLDFWANIKCSACHGRRINMRMGQVCHTCMGRGKARQHILVTALFAKVPETAE